MEGEEKDEDDRGRGSELEDDETGGNGRYRENKGYFQEGYFLKLARTMHMLCTG